MQGHVSRWKKTTLDIDGDADRFACSYLCQKFRKALDKRAAQGRDIRDEWNSGCDRLRLWQACVKLVSLEIADFKELAKNIRNDNMVVQCPHGSQERGKAT